MRILEFTKATQIGAARPCWSALALACAISSANAAVQTADLDLSKLGMAMSPSVTADPDQQRFILSWQARLEDGCAALRVAEMDLQGKLGEVHEVARGCDWFVNWADFPSLVIADNGDWLTYWLHKTAHDTYAYEIQLSRSTDRGNTWSAPITPHDDGTHTEHGFVSMAPLAEDRVLLLWLDGRLSAPAAVGADGHHHEDAMTLRSAVINRAGEITQREQIDAQVCSCCGTELLRIAEGEHMALFRDRSDAEIRDIGLIDRDQGGWKNQRMLHEDGWKIAACPVNGPALATQDGRTLATWATMAGSEQLSVRLRLIDAELGSLLLEHGDGVLGRVDASAFAGGWLVSWVGAAADQQSAVKIATLNADLSGARPLALTTVPRNRNVGMPRQAALGDVAMLLWTEVVEGQKDARGRAQTRLAGMRISPAER